MPALLSSLKNFHPGIKHFTHNQSSFSSASKIKCAKLLEGLLSPISGPMALSCNIV